MGDTFNDLIGGIRKSQSGNNPSCPEQQLRGMKLLTESIDRFNTASSELSGRMIKKYWLQVGLIVIQIGIVLGQIFKRW